MADAAPKEKKKRKSEVKKSDLSGAKKAPATNSSSLDAKEKPGGRKPSTTSDTAPDPKPTAKAETESAEETSKPKAKAKAKPILKPVEVESVPTPTPALKPVVTAEVDENETPDAKPALKSVATVDVEEPSLQPTDKPVATVENVDNEVTPKPIASVEVDEDGVSPSRKSSYVAPKATTRRDVDLLYDMDNEKLAELKEAFHLFDLNNDGFIDKEDLRNTYITLGKTNICEDEIQHMLSEAMNPLDFDAFVILLGYKSIELDPEDILLEALSQWDYDKSGLISEDRIKHDLMMWGDRFSPEEVEMALEDAPVFYMKDNDTSMIDYVQFCKILCGLRKKPK